MSDNDDKQEEIFEQDEVNESSFDNQDDVIESLYDNNDYSQEMASDIPRKKFGEKEYNAAKDKKGKFNNEHYKSKQQELDRRLNDAKRERNTKTKQVADLDENGNAKWKDGEVPKSRTWENGKETTKGMPTKTVNKKFNERLKDDANLLKAQRDRINNKVNNAKANAYKYAHPIENAKENIKADVKEKTKEVTKQVTKKAAEVTKKGAKKAGAAIVKFIAANPWILIVLLFLILFFIILIAVIDDESSKNTKGFKQECNFNLTNVSLTSCTSKINTSSSLDEYVMNTAYKISEGRNLSEESLKALMVILKTNALASGRYNNNNKNISIDDCSIESLYTTTSNINFENLVVNENEYFWWPVGSLETITIDGKLFAKGTPSSTSITSHYGARNTGIEGASTNHKGLDIGNAGNGAGVNNVIASLSGKVITVDYNKYRGNYIKIDHGTYQTLYQHLHPNTTTVKVGDIVYQGQVLAKMGNTGVSGGAHLHFEVFVNNQNVDPEDYISSSNVRPIASDTNNTTIDDNNATIDNTSSPFTIAPEDYKNIYAQIENILYIDKSISGTIRNLDDSNVLNLNEEVITTLENNSLKYDELLNSLYNGAVEEDSVNLYAIYNLQGNCEYVDGSSSSLYSDECGSISLKGTGLTREEFVSKVGTYFSGVSGTWASGFAEKAGTIYDIGVNNDFNPELIVIRALLEGGSPVSYGYNYYNYWGIGCNNGAPLSTCKSYSSFDNGVLGYAQILQGYNVDNLLDVYYVKHYAYIGSNWFNPGNSGLGGCYYYNSIKKYMSESRSEEVGRACASGNTCSGSSCLATTDEDQLAYSKYQIESTANMRKKIFGIDSENCGTYDGNCKLFSQWDSAWGNIKLGSSNTDMRNSGCAVTSIAMGISCSGVKTTVANFDAGTLINALNKGNCFTSEGGIYWGCNAISEIAPGVVLLENIKEIKNWNDTSKISKVTSYDSNSSFVLLHFKNSEHVRGHYVVYSSVSGNYFVTKDPSGGKISNVLISDIDQIVVYSVNKERASV